MEKDLAIYKALATTGQAVASVIQSIKFNKDIRKQDSVIIEEQLAFLRAMCRAKGYGEVTRVSIDEMDSTFQRIKQKNFPNSMSEMVGNLLMTQYQALQRNLQNYARD